MERAQENIKLTLRKHNGDLTYESIMEMKYIDLYVKETLNKYPGLPTLIWEFTKAYHVAGAKFTTWVIISLLGVHRDAQYFSNPETCNLEGKLLRGRLTM